MNIFHRLLSDIENLHQLKKVSSLIAHLLLTVVLFHQFVVATLHWAGQRGRGSACCNVSCSSKPMIVEFVLSFRAPYVSLSLLWVCERAQAAACFYEWRQWGCNRLKGLYILNLIIFPCGWGLFSSASLVSKPLSILGVILHISNLSCTNCPFLLSLLWWTCRFDCGEQRTMCTCIFALLPFIKGSAHMG